MQIYKFSYMIE